ncbi:hypothetical protein EVAR_93186_1 [Eumeta japonica]|uniref:Uncharacterized protein n=1 Tax=Eumeta variegata TaxID=151549 RepID=A0A4C1TXW4_EUMVA|nr:hypothetical protein EVAR_93186_1 [Eumeta japonica]
MSRGYQVLRSTQKGRRSLTRVYRNKFILTPILPPRLSRPQPVVIFPRGSEPATRQDSSRTFPAGVTRGSHSALVADVDAHRNFALKTFCGIRLE